MAKNKLLTTVGIEYTYLYPSDGTDFCFLGAKLSYVDLLKGTTRHAHHDCGALEIPSPVHRTWSGMKRFYTRLHRRAQKLKLKTHKSFQLENGITEDVSNGGGHVHLGMLSKNNKLFYPFYFNIANDFANRPYLNWIFNQWMDNENANHYSAHPKWMRFAQIRRHDWSHSIQSSKSCGLIYREALSTLEFRFFDAPRAWQMVEDHVKFALAYYSYILKRTRTGKQIYARVVTKQQVKSFTKMQCIKEFEQLLRVLKLPVEQYRKYYHNLHDRYAYGRLT